eukprot:TRINITY_DN15835_c0_g1_i1.p1 TRINITY_DN15835_c0_g1~~TRINITY_DN15835_c0_g1_i1.p1  ORF type:complete len:1166 (-),score=126.64 TRINITY_DN15835_c0_g1_i1:8-3421(-)
MNSLKQTFGGARGGGLPLHSFIQVMLDLAEKKTAFFELREGSAGFKPRKLTRHRLSNLFEEIDYNGDQTITWDEFTMYLINEAVQGPEEEQIKPYLAVELPIAPSPSTWKRVVEMGPAYNHRLLLLGSNQLAIANGNLQAHHQFQLNALALDAVFSAQNSLIACSTADLRLHFYNTLHLTGTPFRSVATDVSQLVLRVDPATGHLVSGDRNGWTNLWDLERLRAVSGSHLHEDEPVPMSDVTAGAWNWHSSPITDMTFRPRVNASELITCADDCTLQLHDMNRPEHEKVLIDASASGVHKRGIRSISYCVGYDLLASAGFEFEPMLWALTMSRSPPFRLTDPHTPHTAALVSVACCAPQVISVDSRGTVKVWDVRRMQCVQTFLADKSQPEYVCSGATHIASLERLIVTGKHCAAWDYDVTRTVDIAHEHPVKGVQYISSLHIILTWSSMEVRTWQARTGIVQNTFRRLTDGEITVVVVHEKRFFVGTTYGEIQAHRVSNGLMVRSYERLVDLEVTGLSYFSKRLLLVVSCSDGKLRVIDDGPESNGIARVFNIARCEVTIMVESARLSLLAFANARSTVFCYDPNSSTHGLVHTLPPTPREVTCVAFLGEYPALLVADSSGAIAIYSVRPYHFQGQFRSSCFVRWMHYRSAVPETAKLSERVAPFVTMACFHSARQLLLCGDDKGFVAQYDLSAVVSEVRLGEAHYPLRYRLQEFAQNLAPADLQLPLSHSKVNLQHHHRPHTKAVTGMVLLMGIGYVISSSSDGRVALWTLNGTIQGELQQGRTPLRTAPNLRSYFFPVEDQQGELSDGKYNWKQAQKHVRKEFAQNFFDRLDRMQGSDRARGEEETPCDELGPLLPVVDIPPRTATGIFLPHHLRGIAMEKDEPTTAESKPREDESEAQSFVEYVEISPQALPLVPFSPRQKQAARASPERRAGPPDQNRQQRAALPLVTVPAVVLQNPRAPLKPPPLITAPLPEPLLGKLQRMKGQLESHRGDSSRRHMCCSFHMSSMAIRQVVEPLLDSEGFQPKLHDLRELIEENPEHRNYLDNRPRKHRPDDSCCNSHHHSDDCVVHKGGDRRCSSTAQPVHRASNEPVVRSPRPPKEAAVHPRRRLGTMSLSPVEAVGAETVSIVRFGI